MSRFQALVPPKGIEITIELNALGYHQEVHGTMGPSIFQVFQSQHILKAPNSKALHYILPTYNGKEYTLLFQKKKCRNIVRKYWNKVRPKLSMTTPKSCSSMFGVRGLSWLHHPTTPLCCLFIYHEAVPPTVCSSSWLVTGIKQLVPMELGSSVEHKAENLGNEQASRWISWAQKEVGSILNEPQFLSQGTKTERDHPFSGY